MASNPLILKDWRRGWDSNPRPACARTRFPSVLLQPLGHLSSACVFNALRKGRCQRTDFCVPICGIAKPATSLFLSQDTGLASRSNRVSMVISNACRFLDDTTEAIASMGSGAGGKRPSGSPSPSGGFSTRPRSLCQRPQYLITRLSAPTSMLTVLPGPLRLVVRAGSRQWPRE